MDKSTALIAMKSVLIFGYKLQMYDRKTGKYVQALDLYDFTEDSAVETAESLHPDQYCGMIFWTGHSYC